MHSSKSKVKSIQVNQYEDKFQYKLDFNEHLNIICGENGTGKTKLLQAIKHSQGIEFFDANKPPQIFALNPKRNSQRAEIQQVLQQMRQQNKRIDHYFSENISKQFNDASFDNYSGIAELFAYHFNDHDRVGGDRIGSMDAVVLEFNKVISEVFEEYKIIASWNAELGEPSLFIEKSTQQIPLSGLSCGENEIITLILNIYMTKSRIDVYVIDEPEVHLNWNLEKKLFKFFDNFSKCHNKQIIVTTHSRIVFQPEYTNNVQYLFWNENKVICDKAIPAMVKSKLYEDAVLLISAIEFPEIVIFVEDVSHSDFLQELSLILGVTIRISICGNSGNVKSICRAIVDGNQSGNHYFMIDGDNQGRPKGYPDSLIHLDKYCIENYSLCFDILEQISCKSIKEIKEFIKNLIRTNWAKIFKRDGAMLSCLADKIDVTDLNSDFLDKIDFSELFLEFIEFIGFQSRCSFWAKYLQAAKDKEMLHNIFGERLIQIFS